MREKRVRRAGIAFIFVGVLCPMFWLGLRIALPPERTGEYRELFAHVTGYNTVPAQTDSTPCIAASGANICGRSDAIACPRGIKLGTMIEIKGKMYVCEDRTARKYDSRFDISCDKNKRCPYRVAGWMAVRVFDQ
jgi:hypothetical protein